MASSRVNIAWQSESPAAGACGCRREAWSPAFCSRSKTTVAASIARVLSHEMVHAYLHSLGLTGLYARFEGRIFSAYDVRRGKPALISSATEALPWSWAPRKKNSRNGKTSRAQIAPRPVKPPRQP